MLLCLDIAWLLVVKSHFWPLTDVQDRNPAKPYAESCKIVNR
jgi:hypothetical protein